MEAAESVGIKESMEMLDGVELLLVTAKKIFKDGEVNMDDLGPALEMLQEVKKVVSAVNGMNLIVKEAKDLDQAELVQLALKIQKIVSAVKSA